jgi:hypothetical protein
MPARILAGAMCVQRFDDSLNSAIHITYRISLRSSSMPEPRDPLLKVLIHYEFLLRQYTVNKKIQKSLSPPAGACFRVGRDLTAACFPGAMTRRSNSKGISSQGFGSCKLGNDPSAGSPTETLLRLLLPLNDRVWRAFRP